MSMWTDDKELFGLMKEKLYTPVVGDILDTMGYNHQFLPPEIMPLKDDMKLAGRAVQSWNIMYMKRRKNRSDF